MQAILLAGGKGTRLRPYTAVLPKPLMPIGEVDPLPIMEVVLRQLARFGFRDVTVITGYLTELIEAFFGDGRKLGARLTYEREVTPLGTAGGLAYLKRPEESVLVINGDILTTLDFAAMYRFHARSRGGGDDRVVSSRGQDRLRRARVRRRPARPGRLSREARVLVPGQHGALHPRVPLGLGLPRSRPAPCRCPTSWRRCAKVGHGRSTASSEPCYWLDIGRHDDYATANEVFESRRRSFLGEPGDRVAEPLVRHDPGAPAGDEHRPRDTSAEASPTPGSESTDDRGPHRPRGLPGAAT